MVAEYNAGIPMVDLNMKRPKLRLFLRNHGAKQSKPKELFFGKIIQKSGTPEEKEEAKIKIACASKKNVEDWFVKPWNNDFEKLSPVSNYYFSSSYRRCYPTMV